MTTKYDAYEAGMQAYKDRLNMADCPHPSGSDRLSWLCGWSKAREVATHGK